MRNDTVVKIETAILEYLKANGGIATLSQTDIAKIANVNKSTITRNIEKLDFQDKVKAKPDGNKFYFELVSKDSNKGRSAVSSRFADESIF